MRVRQTFDPAVLRIAGEFIWRTFLIGLVLSVMPPFATAPSASNTVLHLSLSSSGATTTAHLLAEIGRGLCWKAGLVRLGNNVDPGAPLFFRLCGGGLKASANPGRPTSCIPQHGRDQPRASLI